MPLSGAVLVLCVAGILAVYGGKAIGHGAKAVAVKTKHAVVHVVHPHKPLR